MSKPGECIWMLYRRPMTPEFGQRRRKKKTLIIMSQLGEAIWMLYWDRMKILEDTRNYNPLRYSRLADSINRLGAVATVN
jgi:hypothetical protein